MDLEVDGERIPALMQAVKQSFVFTFNRETGEPVWPIEERPVPQSEVPGEHTSETQPFPTNPAPVEMQGLSEDDLIDFTPELREEALELVKDFKIGPLYTPAVQEGNEHGYRGAAACPGGGGGPNIWNPPVADPTTNILYVSTTRACSSYFLAPGEDLDTEDAIGSTVSEWVAGSGGGFRGPQGLPLWKPPYSGIVAIDMNTGEHLWHHPTGNTTPERIANHPALEGVDLPITGKPARPVPLVTGSILMYSEGLGGQAFLHAADKMTGEYIGQIEIPAPGQYGMMTYEHEGEQYVIVQIANRNYPDALLALKLP